MQAIIACGLLAGFLQLFGCGRTVPEPVAAAREFYAKHYDFYLLENNAGVQGWVTPRLQGLLERLKATEDSGIMVVELDMWTGGQDGWIKGKPDFTLVSNDGRIAFVRLDYDFELEDVERRSATLTLEWDAATRRWLVADLAGPETWSFIGLYEGRNKEGETEEPVDPLSGKPGK